MLPQKSWRVAIGLSLLVVPAANAQVTGGVLSVTQSHMS